MTTFKARIHPKVDNQDNLPGTLGDGIQRQMDVQVDADNAMDAKNQIMAKYGVGYSSITMLRATEASRGPWETVGEPEFVEYKDRAAYQLGNALGKSILKVPAVLWKGVFFVLALPLFYIYLWDDALVWIRNLIL